MQEASYRPIEEPLFRYKRACESIDLYDLCQLNSLFEQYSVTEFEIHEKASRSSPFTSYTNLVEKVWFDEFPGCIFHVIDSHSDEPSGYLQWATETNESCSPQKVSTQPKIACISLLT